MFDRYDGNERVKAVASAFVTAFEQLREEVEAYARARIKDVRLRLDETETRPITIVLLSLTAWVALTGLGALIFMIALPNVRNIRAMPFAEATIAYSADGRELARYHIENRTWVGLEKMAPSLVEALIATEDRRFYDHSGVDLPRVFGAITRTASGETQGGSTITMQLARNIFPQLKQDHILVRKVKEWFLAVRIEDLYTKDEILEMYLNVVPFLYETAGVEAASKTYFQKTAAELSLDESATLVGMLKGTAYYNPVRHPERAHMRRNVVLQQMVRFGELSQAEYEEIRERPTELNFHRATRQSNEAPFFAEHIRQWLDDWAEQNGFNLYTDGLRVYTTIDSRLQHAAEAAVVSVTGEMQNVVDVEWSRAAPFFSQNPRAYEAQVASVEPFAYFWNTHPEFVDEILAQSSAYRELIQEGVAHAEALERLRADTELVDSLKRMQQRLEAGFVAIDPNNGHVKAWVGGRDFSHREYDHVAQAKRQPGSTFKPFVYAAALENGYAPYNQLTDVANTFVDPNTGTAWTPQNFGGTTGAFLTLGQALAYSKNTITAKLITSIGPQAVVDIAQRMGIKSPLLAVPSLGLGTSEVSLLELTSAYTTLASQGVHRDPLLVTKIEDRDGKVLARFAPEGKQAIPAHTAHAVLDMMRGGVQYGTAVRLRTMFGARGDLAGKTGTTQNGADGWFMLIHPDLVIGSWMGFYSPKVTFRTNYWGQGAHNALHTVGTFYQQVRKMEGNFLDPAATFPPAPEHKWVSTRRAEIDDLNVRERRSTGVGEILKRIRARKETAESASL